MAAILAMFCMIGAAGADAVGADSAAPPRSLTCADLVDHPERWPAETKLTVELNFSPDILRVGTAVRIKSVTATEAHLRAPQGFTFAAAPTECDLLEQANAAWGNLTPAQRAVDAQSLMTDASLWPAKVTVLPPVTIAGSGQKPPMSFPPGTEFALASFEKEGAHVFALENEGGLMGVKLSDTDFLLRARELAKVPLAERPSRIVDELKGKLMNGDATPANVNFDGTKYFAIYYGANWCPWCHKLSPSLVKTMNEIGSRNPHLSFVMIDDDDDVNEMYKYMKDAQMPWPALPKADAMRVGVLRSMMVTEPQLRILDHYGNELFNCPGGGPDQIQADVDALTKLDQSGKAGASAENPAP